jgi:hypothetical protein
VPDSMGRGSREPQCGRKAMADVTVIATAAISGSVGLAAAGLQAWTGRRQVDAETERQRLQYTRARREDRQKAYQTAIDLVSDFMWDSAEPPAKYDVVATFTKPFVHAANSVRVYGSPQSIAAIDGIQGALAELNSAGTDEEKATAWNSLRAAFDRLVDAARTDVGPGPDEHLAATRFRRGAGPPA